MCGRYVMSLRPSEVRRQLENSRMAVDEAPNDGSVRQSYNFAPGYHGLVYRANGSDDGASRAHGAERGEDDENHDQGKSEDDSSATHVDHTRYKLQSMKWGLVPSWTKRNPDYGSTMKTINCRDDSLYEDRGMWTSMKKRKRCIVVAEGFYEWLKKNNGKEKIPHFTKRKDGQLMCFAGLYDCVQFEGSDEKLYTYTIITTDSNKQLRFLHDRMPVVLDNGSRAIKTWLDPNRTEWSADLQALLKPYEGELECYAVSQEVGKVGNNSRQFVVPIDSAANKSNIANMFGKQARTGRATTGGDDGQGTVVKTEHDASEARETMNRIQGAEDSKAMPDRGPISPRAGQGQGSPGQGQGVKRGRSGAGEEGDTADDGPQQKRALVASSVSPQMTGGAKSVKGTRSAISNGSRAAKAKATAKAKGKAAKQGGRHGSRPITSFFAKEE